jgi:hypothetical protein
MGNKSDRPACLEMSRVHDALNLDEAKTHFKSMGEFKVSLYTGKGYPEALKWLEDNL